MATGDSVRGLIRWHAGPGGDIGKISLLPQQLIAAHLQKRPEDREISVCETFIALGQELALHIDGLRIKRDATEKEVCAAVKKAFKKKFRMNLNSDSYWVTRQPKDHKLVHLSDGWVTHLGAVMLHDTFFRLQACFLVADIPQAKLRAFEQAYPAAHEAVKATMSEKGKQVVNARYRKGGVGASRTARGGRRASTGTSTRLSSVSGSSSDGKQDAGRGRPFRGTESGRKSNAKSGRGGKRRVRAEQVGDSGQRRNTRARARLGEQ